MRLLFLEDMKPDARMLMEAFEECGLDVEVDHVETVDEANAYIDAAIKNKRGRLPDVALLDIRVPGGSGIDVLRHIRSVPALRDMPVLMLTTSSDDRDIHAAREGGASTYYLKPPDLTGFLDLAKELHAFWFERAGPRLTG